MMMTFVKYGHGKFRNQENQTIVSDQSELTILLCQQMNSLLLNEDDLAMVQQPSTITILYI